MKKYVKMGISAVIVIGLIVGCFYYMTHRETREADDDVEITRLHQIINKQLDTSYPPTPREVIKLYNNIIECAYNDEYDTEQYDKLTVQARKLMDDELLESNPLDTYKNQLLQEISSYKEESRKILQTGVCNTDEVRYTQIEGKKCAYVQATYFIKEGKSDFFRTYQSYLLRQDKDKRWKIVAYHVTDAIDEEL